MEFIYSHGETTATDVLKGITDPPTRAAVRTFLRILEEKGHITHTKRGREFVYTTVRPKQKAAQSALQRLLHTFFGGSMESAVASYLSDPEAKHSPDELSRLSSLIQNAKHEDENRS